MGVASESWTHLAGRTVGYKQIQEWVETFHRQGFLFFQNVLLPVLCAELRDDLDRALQDNPNDLACLNERIHISHRMFEYSPANLKLFDLEPIASFAEALIALNCHIIHNNSFRTPPGGGLTGWHQDDPPQYTVTHGPPPHKHPPARPLFH